MRKRRGCVLLLIVLVGQSVVGCSTPNPWVRVVYTPDGVLGVEGPAAGPFKTKAELAETACKLMIGQPGASAEHGQRGVEYCALYYYSKQDEAYFLSFFSDVRAIESGGFKNCKVPRVIYDPARQDAIIVGPAHPHPHNPVFSPQDLGAGRGTRAGLGTGETPVGVSKFFDNATGKIWERELLLFWGYKERRECYAYSYNYSTRVVSALRNGKWVAIGIAEGQYGSLRMYEGQSWFPSK